MAVATHTSRTILNRSKFATLFYGGENESRIWPWLLLYLWVSNAGTYIWNSLKQNWRARAEYDFLLIKYAFCKWNEMNRVSANIWSILLPILFFSPLQSHRSNTFCRFVYILIVCIHNVQRAGASVQILLFASFVRRSKFNLWVDFCWCLAIISVRTQ